MNTRIAGVLSGHRLATTTILTVMIAGCVASSEVVHLKHPVKGDVIKCGPYQVPASKRASASVTAQNELRYCVEDFQRQGYQRIPSPG